MLLNPFARRGNTHALAVGMAGVKMGDRFAQIGCADGRRLAAIAAKVGLSGRAVAFVPDEAAAARARKGGEREGVLIEVEIAPPVRLPGEDESFDVVLIDDSAGLLAGLADHQRTAAVREAGRIVRPGGRVMIVGAGTATGVAALTRRGAAPAGYDRVALLQQAGLKSARLLADREGLLFVEAVKARS